MSNNRVQAEHCANPALFDRYELKLVDDPYGRPFTTWAAEITDSRTGVAIEATLVENEYGAHYSYGVDWEHSKVLDEFFNVAKRAFPKVKRSVAPDYMCEYIIHAIENN